MKLAMNQKGFTLIELVVVIVILGILAAIAVPRYLDMSANAERAANEANARAIEAAIMMQYAQNLTDNDATNDDLEVIAGAVDGTYFSDGTMPTVQPSGDFTITADNDAGTVSVTY